jgi:hypothetical protein
MLIDFEFKNFLSNVIIKSNIKNKYNFTYPNQKYKLDEILDGIIYVLKSGISWRNYIGNINWQTLNHHFNILRNNDIFLKSYKKLLKLYQKIFTYNEDIFMSDTSFIKNNIGIKK